MIPVSGDVEPEPFAGWERGPRPRLPSFILEPTLALARLQRICTISRSPRSLRRMMLAKRMGVLTTTSSAAFLTTSGCEKA
jgi:hypothetical protein